MITGFASISKAIKPFSSYKPHFSNLRNLHAQNSEKWRLTKGWGLKEKTMPQTIDLAENVTKILSENPTIKTRAKAIGDYQKKTGIGEKSFNNMLYRLTVGNQTNLGDTKVPVLPKDVAKEYNSFAKGRQYGLEPPEALLAFVQKKFNKPVSPETHVFDEPAKAGQFEGAYVGREALHVGLKHIRQYLNKTQLKNLNNYRNQRMAGRWKMDANLETLHKNLEGKIIKNPKTRDEALDNIDAFKDSFRKLGMQNRIDFQMKYLKAYNNKYKTNILQYQDVYKKFGLKKFEDVPLLKDVRDPRKAHVLMKMVRDQWKNKPQSIIESAAFQKGMGASVMESINRLFPREKNYFDFDHVKSFMFGGKNEIDNISAVHRKPHRGTTLKKEFTPEGTTLKMKTEFERDVYDNYNEIINLVNEGNVRRAEQLSKETKDMISYAMNRDVPFRFAIDEPYGAYRVGKNEAQFFNQIDLLGKDDQAKAIIRSLITKIEHTPKMLKSNLRGEERLISDLQGIYTRLAPFSELRKAGMPREGIMTSMPYRKKGGLINGHLTDTIAPERGPMPEGLPLLDPLESIDRSRRQHFQVGGFANLFGKLGRVPKAVGRFGDIKKPSLAKPKATTEVVVGQAVEDKPAMFLSTVNAIEDMPDAANMNAQQWLGTIRNKPGVSATELDEFGLEALLTNMHKANPKQKLTKAQLIENYNREMPKIDMDIAIAEPVSRGGKDLAKMLLDVREKRGPSHYDDQVDIFSNDARLLTDLHQPPQDRVGFVLRGKLIDIMKGTTKVAPRADQEDQIIKLLEPTGRQAYHFQTRDSVFKELWEKAFPNLFHTTNNIVKQGYRDELATLVPSQDVTKLSIAKNISEEQAFEELYQALNIFDRQVMTADVPIPFWTKKLLYRLGDMSEGRGFFYKSKRTPAHEGAQFIPGGSGYGELKFYQNFDTGAVRAKEADYRSGHFSGEVFQGNTGNSPFGWLRFSERIDESGRKILMAEEIQSDLHQAVAQKGYNYAPRLDKHDVLAEMGEFAKQLDTKKQTLESTRLRKDAIKALPRVERESEANVAELKNIEKAIKKLIGDVKKLQKKVEAQAKATGRSGQVHPDTAFKKSENYAKLFMQGLMKMANDKGYDGVALSTGKMKKAHGAIPKGGDKFYDEIGVKAMKRMAKKSGFNFTDTTIVDGNGFTWEKIPLIEMRDINTGIKIPGEATIPVYKKGGIVNKKMVKK